MQLVQPDRKYLKSYQAYYQEWMASGEPIVPSVVEEVPPEKAMFEQLSQRSRGINLPAGRVPDSTCWFVDEKEKVIGACNIRHDLTIFLKNSGGHIGYDVAPSSRKQGVGKAILGASLLKAHSLGLREVLVVCDHWNAPSRNIINAYFPRRIEDYHEEDGSIVERYWIKTRRDLDE